jgi:hypothetical protein
MDEEGGYRPNSGSYDDLNDKPEASLSINPKSIKGLENYRGNDTVNLTVKVRLPQDMEGEEGMIEPEIISVTAEPMEDGARVTRMREKAGRTF